jgi:hypothetical protein
VASADLDPFLDPDFDLTLILTLAVTLTPLARFVQLARNRRLDEWFVRNLNAEPDGWALAAGSVDAVLICVSVQVRCRTALQTGRVRPLSMFDHSEKEAASQLSQQTTDR